MKLNQYLNLAEVSEICVDVESYGLKFEQELFSVQISIPGQESYYYNLKEYEDAPWLPVITPEELKDLTLELSGYTGIVYAANATFDLQKLALYGIHLSEAKIHCTHTFEKLKDPENRPKLANYAPKYGLEKLDTVEAYVKEHNLYHPKRDYMGVTLPKEDRYDLVPWKIMSEYATNDAEITLQIGMKQREELHDHTLFECTQKFTRAIHNIHMTGIRLNLDYCRERFAHHKNICFNILNEQEPGFKDGKLYLTELFNKHDLPITYKVDKIKRTKEPVFAGYVLEQYTHIKEIDAILKYREHYKLYRSFYFNLIYYAVKGRLHVSLNPYGTATSRMSTSKPALQTLPRDNKEVKQALIPDEGCFFLEMDYSGMEIRLAFDLAGQSVAVKKMNEGMDMHQQTANSLRISRNEAKITTFSILYGSGVRRISQQLNIPYERARKIRADFFKEYYKLKILDDKLKNQAHIHGYIKNRYARLLHLPKDKTYKALNAHIQSTGADVMRIAMVKIDEYIKNNNLKSRVVLSVHDSLLLNMPFSEAEHQKKFKTIMEQAYTSKCGVHMECDAKHSTNSYGDLEDGIYQEN